MKKNKLKEFEVKFDDFAEEGEVGIAKGYLSVFDIEDHVGDVVVKGAYTESLKENNPIPFLWMHNPEMPIGVIHAKEDSYGLYVECKFYLNTELGREKYELSKANADNGLKSGLSIGYQVLDREYGAFRESEQVRFLKKINLREGSLVTWACLEAAFLTDIKSDENEETDIKVRDVEYALRDLGYSNSSSKKYANLVMKTLREEGEVVDETPIIEETIESKEPIVEEVIATPPVEEPIVQDEEEKFGDNEIEELKNALQIFNLKNRMEKL